MKAGQQSASSGLSTDTIKIQIAGVHSLYSRSTCVEPSGMVVTMSQTGSVTSSFSTPATSAQTNHIEMNAKFNCAVGDTLTVAVTSSARADQPPQLIKTLINLKQGV